MRRLMWLVMLLILMPVSTQAAGAEWQAWVGYDNHLTLIDSTGAVLRSVTLPYFERHFEILYGAEISRDGQFAAYNSITQIDQTKISKLIVYDLFHNEVVFIKQVWARDIHFSPSGDAIAYLTDSDSKQFGFEITQMSDGRVTAAEQIQFDQVQTGFADQEFPEFSIQGFDGESITLYLSTKSKAAFLKWTPNQILVEAASITVVKDRLAATGETLVMQNDYNYMGITGNPNEYNTLQLLDSEAQHSTLIYHGLVNRWDEASFVQSGERILLEQSISKPPKRYQRGYPPIEDHLYLFNRQGKQLDSLILPLNQYAGHFFNTPNGFIYTTYHATVTSIQSTSIPAVYEMDTRQGFGQGRLVWHVSSDQLNIFNQKRSYLGIFWVGFTA